MQCRDLQKDTNDRATSVRSCIKHVLVRGQDFVYSEICWEFLAFSIVICLYAPGNDSVDENAALDAMINNAVEAARKPPQVYF